jgi:hypothetical protein
MGAQLQIKLLHCGAELVARDIAVIRDPKNYRFRFEEDVSGFCAIDTVEWAFLGWAVSTGEEEVAASHVTHCVLQHLEVYLPVGTHFDKTVDS